MREQSCRVFDLSYKEVINLHDGARLGYVGDVDIDLESGRVTALIIPGRLRLLGLLGREEDAVVPWENIEKIGEDIILVRHGAVRAGGGRPKRGGLF